ncbi:hypothetical protein QE152_g39758 [Popillia japonica]|uniref:Uncharacterized protein n=1 Tax=Popillia japonica TaxID=7064 RepID=A0AAW1HT99_POPJA
MQTLPAANWGGILGDVGDNTANPRNMKVRTKLPLSCRSLANTSTTCWHFSCSSAASNRATSASREPSGRMHGGRATYSVLPHSTASHCCRGVRKVSRSGGEPLVAPGASGPPQRPCSQRHSRASRG